MSARIDDRVRDCPDARHANADALSRRPRWTCDCSCGQSTNLVCKEELAKRESSRKCEKNGLIIQEATQDLLEQHNCYDVSQLTAYLRTYYPEIPENFRAPVVIAATTAARQAAHLHYVWRDNHNSPDGHKRH